MIRHLLIYWVVFIGLGNVYAQHQIQPCATQQYIDYLEDQEIGISQNIEETFFEAKRNALIKQKKSQDTVYTIKVVFHVVYNRTSQNLGDDYILSQLQILNDCFRRTNADTVNTREIFLPVAADAGIEFELAKVDAQGNPTTGIVRKQTSLTTFGTFPTNLDAVDRVKTAQLGSEPWDTDKYLNIWICDLSVNGFDALLGYAYPPTNADHWNTNSFTTKNKQGVVVHYKVVGEDNPESLSTGSKTMVHEVGHYLGLRHTWGDGPRNQGCNVDDFMEDTPNSRSASNGCNLGQNTCIDNPSDLPDMLENYMDYSDDDCQNMFTAQQVDQMRSNLVMFRSGIATVRYPEPEITFAQYALYPNPIIDGLSINLANVDENAAYHIEIYTTFGQLVYSRAIVPKSMQKIQGLFAIQGIAVCKLYKNDEEVITQKMVFNP